MMAVPAPPLHQPACGMFVLRQSPWRALFLRESEVGLGVVVADGADDFLQGVHVVGIHALLHPLAEHAAEYAAEVFVDSRDNGK